MVPRLTVTPADALIDVPRHLKAEGFLPGAEAILSASTRRGERVWKSAARFVIAADGSVDPSALAPLEGSDYTGLSPMGLIWSQRPEGEGEALLLPADLREGLRTEVVAESGAVRIPATFFQRFLAPGVVRRAVREDGLVGTLFLPPGTGPHPAVMLLNGSNGGTNEPRAALLAAHGYAAFTLAYFGLPGLPRYISRAPLEYFRDGLTWLRRNIQPRDGFVAVMGQSRGGELALLLGATFPEAVSAVLAYVPGAVVHSGQNAADPAVGRNGPTWLLNGRPLPHLWEGNRTATWAPFDEGPAPHRHEWAILTALADPEAVARARIPVERIRGPVLLISGTDDGCWPSSFYCRMVRDSMAKAAHPHEVLWYDFAEAGHAIREPYQPTTAIVWTHPVSGRVSTGGGTPAANARASEHAWKATLEFLGRASAVDGPKGPRVSP